MRFRRDATAESQRAGFGETLRLARSTSFYREHWAAVSGVTNLDGIQALPTIDKTDLAQNGRRMLTEHTFPDQVLITGGSTFRAGDEVSFRELSCGEYAAFDQLAEAISTPKGKVSISLELISELHGASVGFRRAAFRLPLSRDNHFAAINQLLAARHDYVNTTERVKVLVGSVESLRVLAALREQQSPKPDWAVVACLATSAHLGHLNRSALSSAIEGEVFSCYGLTEVSGSTSIECGLCRHFHLPPTVYGEFLDVESHAGRTDVKELCLTSLAPFQVRQPLVRYRTGDLVVLASQACEASPSPGFQPIGRRATSQWTVRQREVIVPDNLLAERLGGEPRFCTLPYPSTAFLNLTAPPSVPRLRIALSSEALRLHIEAYEQTDELQRLAEKVVHELVEEYNAGVRVDVQVTLHPPRGLTIL